MTKIVVMVVLCVIFVGIGLYLAGSKVGPGVNTKGNSINTSITTAAVNTTTGAVTMTAP